MHIKLGIVAVFCLLAGIQASAQTDVFVTPPQYATSIPFGYTPVALAVGDFNNDGKLDLAVVSDSNPGVVSILLGNGDGSFQTHVDYAVGSEPVSVAVADLNGDGNLDLAIANSSGSLSVLFGNGDGTFQTAVGYATAAQPISIAVGDFNGDGKLDLAVANVGASSVSIFLNSGNGTFPSRMDFATGYFPQSVTVGDFDGDGKLDLAVANACGTVTPGSNCDGPYINGTVSVLLGNGDGTFQAHVDYVVGIIPVYVTAADLNGDGNLDLLVADSGGIGLPPLGGDVTVLWGNGSGSFTAQQFTTGYRPSSVVVGDFNGDGRLDFVVTNEFDATVSIFVDQSSMNFAQPAFFYGASGFAQTAVAGDFNGDGKLDLAVGCGSGVCILMGDGKASFSQTPLSYPTGNGAISVAVSDLNGDKKSDAVVANLLDNDVSVFLGNGDGTFQSQVNYSTGIGPTSVVIGDINHDGNPDLAVANQTANTVSVLLGNGDGTFQTHVDYPTANGPSFLAIGDLNGDGNLDLAVACTNSSSVSILLGNGDGTFRAHSDLGVGDPPTGITLGDFNGDGKLDLAVLNGTEITILLNNGDGSFGGPAPIALLPGIGLSEYSGIQSADLNGDGKLDLAVTGLYEGLIVLLGNGDGTFQAPAIYYSHAPGSGPSIAIGDFNGDGFLDVATGSGSGTTLFLGNGDGSFQAPQLYTTGHGSNSGGGNALAAGDLTGDGKLDLTVANGSSSGGSNTLTILLNTGQSVASFKLAASPESQTVYAGNSATFTVTGITVNGFNSPVALTCTGEPSGSTCNATPASIIPTSGGASSTVTVTTSASTPADTYILAIAGTSGAEQFTVDLSLMVTIAPDFSVSAPSSPTPSSVTPGQSATATLTLASTGGFAGMVTFTCTVSPAPPLAPTCSWAPAQVQLTSGGQASSTLTINTTGSTAFLARPNLDHDLSPIYAVVFPIVGVVLGGIGFKSANGRNKIHSLVILCVLIESLLFQAACGGPGTTATTGSSGTPAGSYTVSVTATSGSTQQTTSLALTVQ
jgi:hypothetical protein